MLLADHADNVVLLLEVEQRNVFPQQNQDLRRVRLAKRSHLLNYRRWNQIRYVVHCQVALSTHPSACKLDCLQDVSRLAVYALIARLRIVLIATCIVVGGSRCGLVFSVLLFFLLFLDLICKGEIGLVEVDVEIKTIVVPGHIRSLHGVIQGGGQYPQIGIRLVKAFLRKHR